MDVILKILTEQGVLVLAFLYSIRCLERFLDETKAERKEQREQQKIDKIDAKNERAEHKELTKKLIILTEGFQTTVEENNEVQKGLINALSYSKESHERLEAYSKEHGCTLEIIKSDIQLLKEKAENDDNIMPMLEKIDTKLGVITEEVNK